MEAPYSCENGLHCLNHPPFPSFVCSGPEYARSLVLGAKNLPEKGPLEIPEDQNQRTLAGGDQEEEPPDCSGFEDSTIYAGVPSKGTGTPQDLPQASDAQSIREDIDQWMKRKEEEFAKFMAAHKKTSDRLTELALQEIEESPLTDEIMAQALPPKFVIPKINVYNGTLND